MLIKLVSQDIELSSDDNSSVKLNTVIINMLACFLFESRAVTHSYRQKHKLWTVGRHHGIDQGQTTDHRETDQCSIYLCDVSKETTAALSKLMIWVISREAQCQCKPQICISYCSKVQTIEALPISASQAQQRTNPNGPRQNSIA